VAGGDEIGETSRSGLSPAEAERERQ
jgi:hypothetical protein